MGIEMFSFQSEATRPTIPLPWVLIFRDSEIEVEVYEI